jgi:ribosomal protein S11
MISPQMEKLYCPAFLYKKMAQLSTTTITVTNQKGDVIPWSSFCGYGFKDFRKATLFSTKTAAITSTKQSIAQGMRQAQVFLKGVRSR